MPDIKFEAWQTIMIAILVLFLGQLLNNRIRILKRFNIPEPVSSGLVVALFIAMYFLFTGRTISFALFYRDILMIVFFTSVGLSSRFADLKRGGKPFFVLLFLCSLLIIMQNIVGMGVAVSLGETSLMGLMGGSVSLVGGIGTSVAWANVMAKDYGLPNAMEIGIACATMGLVMGSLSGGPVGEFLIRKYKLEANAVTTFGNTEVSHNEEVPVSEDSFIYSVFIIGVAVGIGMYLNKLLAQTSFRLPAYVTCMFAGIVMSNSVPPFIPQTRLAHSPCKFKFDFQPESWIISFHDINESAALDPGFGCSTFTADHGRATPGHYIVRGLYRLPCHSKRL